MTHSISHILTVSSDIWIDKKSGIKSSISNLRQGHIVEAKVDKAVTSRQARLVIDGKPVMARTYVPLKAGERLLLRVTETGTQPRFQLIDAKDSDLVLLPKRAVEVLGRPGIYGILSKVLKGLGDTSPATEAFERLAGLARNFSVKSQGMDSSYLKSVIQKSGLTWENKLQTLFADNRPLTAPMIKSLVDSDLKALAMQLSMNLSKDTESVMNLVRTLSEDIEQFQLINNHSSRENGKYLLPIPLFLDGTFKFGQLLIDLGKENRSRENPSDRMISVSLLLEMTQLGNIRADMTLLKEEISTAFGVEDAETRTLIQAHIPQLVKKLQQNGFTVHPIICRIIESQILSATSFADEFIGSNDGILNIVI